MQTLWMQVWWEKTGNKVPEEEHNHDGPSLWDGSKSYGSLWVSNHMKMMTAAQDFWLPPSLHLHLHPFPSRFLLSLI